MKSPKKKLSLEKGQITTLTTDPVYEEHVTEDMIFVDYENLPTVVQPGDKVVLNSGSITLSALECAESIIRCLVEKAGELLSRSSVEVPNVPIEVPSFSESDKELIKRCISECIDFLFLTGVNSKEAVVEARELLGKDGQFIALVPKIDNQTAIENIDKIIDVSDGLYLDCDKLVTQLPKEKVFLLQKSITAKCNLAGQYTIILDQASKLAVVSRGNLRSKFFVGKPVICPIKLSNPRSISKAEICDIANAVLDGVDSLAIPHDCCTRDAIVSISTICREAEPAVYQKRTFNDLSNNIAYPMEAVYALTISAVESALKTNAAVIICLTSSGRTPRLLSR